MIIIVVVLLMWAGKFVDFIQLKKRKNEEKKEGPTSRKRGELIFSVKLTQDHFSHNNNSNVCFV